MSGVSKMDSDAVATYERWSKHWYEVCGGSRRYA
jgi:hypothetical protein